jgi:predicted RNase H-like nuclease
MLVAGIDGYRKGWVAVVLRDGRFADALARRGLADLVAALPDAAAIGIDIPIGLPVSGRRSADLEARAFIGPRRNTVFFAVPRAVWAAADAAEARAESLRLDGYSVSSQTLALGPKVLEADALARVDGRIHEVHPEVTFAAMAGRYLGHPKSTWAGMQERMGLLQEVGISLPADPGWRVRPASTTYLTRPRPRGVQTGSRRALRAGCQRLEIEVRTASSQRSGTRSYLVRGTELGRVTAAAAPRHVSHGSLALPSLRTAIVRRLHTRHRSRWTPRLWL